MMIIMVQRLYLCRAIGCLFLPMEACTALSSWNRSRLNLLGLLSKLYCFQQCGFAFNIWEAIKGNDNSLYCLGSLLNIPDWQAKEVSRACHCFWFWFLFLFLFVCLFVYHIERSVLSPHRVQQGKLALPFPIWGTWLGWTACLRLGWDVVEEQRFESISYQATVFFQNCHG